jgi:hypothetical protein
MIAHLFIDSPSPGCFAFGLEPLRCTCCPLFLAFAAKRMAHGV